MNISNDLLARNNSYSNGATKKYRSILLCGGAWAVLLAAPAARAQNTPDTWTGQYPNGSEISDWQNWALYADFTNGAIINAQAPTTSQSATWTITEGDGYWNIAQGGTTGSLKIGNAPGSEGLLTVQTSGAMPTGNSTRYIAHLNTTGAIEVGTGGGTGTLTLNLGRNGSSLGGTKLVSLTGSTTVASDAGLRVGAGAGSVGTVNLLGDGKSVKAQNHYASTPIEGGTWGFSPLDFTAVPQYKETYAIGTGGGTGIINVHGASLVLDYYTGSAAD